MFSNLKAIISDYLVLLNILEFFESLLFVVTVKLEFCKKELNYLYITIPVKIINNKENSPPIIDGI